MGWHLAKYEPAPFLPPWLYITLAVGTILLYFIYYLLKSKIRLDFKPFNIDGLHFEPLNFKSASQMENFQFILDSLLNMDGKFFEMNSKRFGACGMSVKSGEAISLMTFFPVRFVPYRDTSFDIEWLPRFAFSVPESSQLALIVDHALFADEHRDEKQSRRIVTALLNIASDLEMGKLLFWPTVNEILSSENLEKMGYSVIKQDDKYYIDIDQIQNSISQINKSKINGGE